MEIVENGEDRMDLHGFAGFNPDSGACYRGAARECKMFVVCRASSCIFLPFGQEKGALTWRSGEELEEVKRYIH